MRADRTQIGLNQDDWKKGRDRRLLARHYKTLNAISSPGSPAPLIATTMYCLPLIM
jgi:hypothetical protein